ncbi:MAG TPA: GntR family transcriptional regulator [Candidatus Micrarchaeia archaeon]|nr:GntR family transcriptional regulator [Candidatus Micrarchaeia archaeon]
MTHRSGREGYLPRSHLLTQQLREEILGGHLAPGQRLRQEDLASRFAISRIPVREALRQLASEGLITIVPHSGARVSTLDPGELDELYRIREQLDPLAVTLSLPRLSAEDCLALRRRVEAMEDLSGRDELDGRLHWLVEDVQFHLATYAGSNAPTLLRIVQTLLNRAQPYRRALIVLLPDLQTQNAEHRLLLDAIERHDAASAAQMLEVHIRRTRLTLSSRREVFSQPLAAGNTGEHRCAPHTTG